MIESGKLTTGSVAIQFDVSYTCLLYTSDAADERSSVDLGGRRIIKKKKKEKEEHTRNNKKKNKRRREYTTI